LFSRHHQSSSYRIGRGAVEEIVQIAKANSDKKIAIHAPLDERREETEALINLGVERMFP
jgi:hypothetical protein